MNAMELSNLRVVTKAQVAANIAGHRLNDAYRHATRLIRRAREMGVDVDGTYDSPMYHLICAHEIGDYKRIGSV